MGIAERRRVDRVHWFRVLVDLQREGVTHSTVAKQLEIPPPTLHGWKHGSEPPHCDGVRLVALWASVTGREPSEVPMVSPFDWRA